MRYSISTSKTEDAVRLTFLDINGIPAHVARLDPNSARSLAAALQAEAGNVEARAMRRKRRERTKK